MARASKGNIFRVLWNKPNTKETLHRNFPTFAENNCALPGAKRGRKGRFVHIKSLAFVGSGVEKVINLQEVQAYSADGTFLKPIGATMSSVESATHDARKCIDGVVDASSASGGNDTNAGNYCKSKSGANDGDPWLRINYGNAAVSISKIVVTNVNSQNYNDKLKVAGATVVITTDSAGKKVVWEGVLAGTQNTYTLLTTQDCQPIAVRGGSCLCDFTVKTEPVYTAANATLPSEAQLRSTLFQASFAPAQYGKDVYTKCGTESCTATQGVAVYTKGKSKRPTNFDMHTIFEITGAVDGAYGRKSTKYYFNKQNSIQVGASVDASGGDDSDAGTSVGAQYTFRNPPNFVPNVGVHPGHPGYGNSWRGGYSPYGNTEIWATAATYETNALIHHLFTHDNTPPFVAKLLIQRLVTSNPSPRYVLAVSTAFRQGKYGGKTFSGTYGDMAATISAILLDREARATIVDVDPKHGSLREPLLKVMHMLRAAEYKPVDGKQVTMQSMEKKIGQQVFRSPTVFNYYLPEFSPVGLIADHGLVSPESQLATAPFMVGFMNGMASLIENGLTSCDRGFGDQSGRESLNLCHRGLNQNGMALHKQDGTLTLMLDSPSTPQRAVDELAVLLTSGRLNQQSRRVIVDAYEDVLSNTQLNLTGFKASSSSKAAGTRPQNAVNGVTLGWENDNDNDACHKTRSDKPPWWSIKIGSATDVTSVAVQGQSDCCAGKTLSGFDIFVDDVKCASNVMIQTGERKVVPCVATGSVVKIQKASKTTPSELVLCDVQLFARNVSSTGAYEANPAVEANALKQALKLFSIVPEYHATNENIAKSTERVAPPEQENRGRKYKAVVVVFLEGGMDSFNMLVPYSGCTKPKNQGGAQGKRVPNDLYAEYARVRGPSVAISKQNLLPIKTDGSKQPCDTFGIHPALPVLQKLYDEGDATFIANAGAMIEPVTKEEFIENKKRTPPSLFAHNIMQRSAYTAHAESASASGVLGRMTAALMSGAAPLKSALYSTVGYSKMMEGAEIQPTHIDPDEGIVRFKEYAEMASKIANLSSLESHSLFAEHYSATLDSVLRTTEALGDWMEDPKLPTESPLFHSDTLSQQLEKVSVVMRLDKSDLKTERSAFMTKQPGFDSHGAMDISPNLRAVNQALDSFVEELKVQGTWNETVIVCLSDFGRTLVPNAQGTDHGWGGNYFLLGGNVRGGQILGQFPDRLDEAYNDVSLGRGRVLPTTPWEAIWNGVADWWGVDKKDKAAILPHAANFPPSTLFTQKQLFL